MDSLTEIILRYCVLSLLMCCCTGKKTSDDSFQGTSIDHISSTYEWSKWGPWSTCSRTCGGGVSVQTRHCIKRNADNSTEMLPGPLQTCVGETHQYHECNTNPCIGVFRESRAEQCSQFDGRPFRGRYYIWIPYVDGNSPCTLNCRPSGQSFYASLALVADGTPCTVPGHRAICIQGTCKVVGKESVLSSAGIREAHCGRRLVSGLFTRPRLPLGYTHVATVPRGACRLNVSEILTSDNYIALKITNGSYIINGEFAISSPGPYDVAGARFHYKRISGLDTVFAHGPLQQSIDIMILYTKSKTNIKYEYLTDASVDETSLAKDDGSATKSSVNRHLRRRHEQKSHSKDVFMSDGISKHSSVTGRAVLYDNSIEENIVNTRTFVWRVISYTQCSRSCGGGFQIGKFKCVESSGSAPDKEVSIAHCTGSAPVAKRRSCGSVPCDPRWRSTAWSICPQCGPATRTRNVGCVQDHAKGIIKVNDHKCLDPKPEAAEKCDIPDCAQTTNKIHSPEVIRPKTGKNDVDHFRDGPVYTLSVKNDDDLDPEHSVNLPGGWLTSEWSECVGWCIGGGIQTRTVKCADPSGCLSSQSPNTTRSCETHLSCESFEPQWFTGEWSACTSSCRGRQVRGVLCVGGAGRRLRDTACKSPRPHSQRDCGELSSPTWYTGDWTECSGECDKGIQRRAVWCSQDGIASVSDQDCPVPKPASQQICNPEVCNSPKKSYPVSDQPSETNDDADMDVREEIPNDVVPTVKDSKTENIGTRDCKDKLSTCSLAVQARLCHYNYYMENCCQSCV